MENFGGSFGRIDDAQANLPFRVQLTAGPDVNGFYAWAEQVGGPTGSAGWTSYDGGRTGTQANNPAFEANGNTVADNTVVQIRFEYIDETYGFVYSFDAPGAASTFSGALKYFAGQLTEVDNTTMVLNLDAVTHALQYPFDTDSYFDAGTPTRLTAPVSGCYAINANGLWDGGTWTTPGGGSPSGTPEFFAQLVLNATAILCQIVGPPSFNPTSGMDYDTVGQLLHVSIYLNAGDYVEVWATPLTGGGGSVGLGGQTQYIGNFGMVLL
jgi:hypothetical protein